MVSNSEPLPEGTVIMADSQFAGRGQQNNTWHAAPGLNLTISVFLRPVFLALNQQFTLNMAVCIGIRNALVPLAGPEVMIKWPNDVYFRGRKLGGILIENVVSGVAYKSAVVGIGINVNQIEFDPGQVKSATSLREILQQDVNLLALLADICKGIEVQYLKLKSGSSDLISDYLSALYKFEQSAKFRDKNGGFEGIIEGVSPSGQLQVRAGAQHLTYNFKEIEFL